MIILADLLTQSNYWTRLFLFWCPVRVKNEVGIRDRCVLDIFYFVDKLLYFIVGHAARNPEWPEDCMDRKCLNLAGFCKFQCSCIHWWKNPMASPADAERFKFTFSQGLFCIQQIVIIRNFVICGREYRNIFLKSDLEKNTHTLARRLILRRWQDISRDRTVIKILLRW